MSFCNELKQHLLSEAPTSECCLNAFECGRNAVPYQPVCDKCDRAYLRALFAYHGYISEPSKRCELVLRVDGDNAYFVAGMLADCGVPPSFGKRNGKTILYYKKRESLEDFVTLLGAAKFAVTLKEEAVIQEIRCSVNRTGNALTANINRSSKACAEQLNAINRLIEAKEYQKLPPELREAADIRLEHPAESLEQLRVYFSAPISKSGIKHRFERIIDIADNLS